MDPGILGSSLAGDVRAVLLEADGGGVFGLGRDLQKDHEPSHDREADCRAERARDEDVGSLFPE